MKNLICFVIIFLFVAECNADIRVLEQLTLKRNIKHKNAVAKSDVPKVKTKSPIVKHKKNKQKNAIDNRASKSVKRKEIVTTEDLEIRNELAYLSNQDKPFTGKHVEYHNIVNNGGLVGSNQVGDAKLGRKDKKYIEILYKDGKKNGPVTMWDENGIKIGVIYYKDGILVD